MSKAQNAAKKIVDDIAGQVAEQVKAQIAADSEPQDDGKLLYKNASGEMLMCDLTVQKRGGAPDPLVVTVNEEIRWIKRGMPCVVPWYIVEVLKNNVETGYAQIKHQDGTSEVVREDKPAENFSYRAIDPAPGQKPF